MESKCQNSGTNPEWILNQVKETKLRSYQDHCQETTEEADGGGGVLRLLENQHRKKTPHFSF